MNNQRNTVTIGLALMSLLGGIILLTSVTSPPGINLLVQSNSGGSVKLGEDILLRGEPIRSGDSFRTIQHPLTLVTSDRSLVMKFSAGSHATVHRVFPNTARVNLTIHSGTGVIRVNHGRFTGTIGQNNHDVKQGVIRWERGKNSFKITEHPQPRQDIEPRVAATFSLSLDQVPDKKQQWHLGSLMSGTRVKRAIQQYFMRHGKAPVRLRDVFGYWVRDRRGNLFLYEHDQSGFTVTSAGRDQSLLTEDDKQWTGTFQTSDNS